MNSELKQQIDLNHNVRDFLMNYDYTEQKITDIFNQCNKYYMPFEHIDSDFANCIAKFCTYENLDYSETITQLELFMMYPLSNDINNVEEYVDEDNGDHCFIVRDCESHKIIKDYTLNSDEYDYMLK